MSQDTHFSKMQALYFGDRYKGACFAKTNLQETEAKKIMDWMSQPKNFLIIVGPPGTGKTHICASILPKIMARGNTVRAYSERQLLTRLRKSIDESTSGDYLAQLQLLFDDDVIILDDIGSSGYTAWREEVLMEAIDLRYHSRKPAIFTSNLSKEDFMQDYNYRIFSRLFATENCVIDLFGYPDLRQQGI